MNIDKPLGSWYSKLRYVYPYAHLMRGILREKKSLPYISTSSEYVVMELTK